VPLAGDRGRNFGLLASDHWEGAVKSAIGGLRVHAHSPLLGPAVRPTSSPRRTRSGPLYSANGYDDVLHHRFVRRACGRDGGRLAQNRLQGLISGPRRMDGLS
jgi:hypothetical protein